MDDQKARRRLERERSRLQRIRDDLAAELDEETEYVGGAELSTYDQHPGDLGTETFEQEKNIALLDQIDAELVDVNEALQRLDAGQYGICQACGKPIGNARLEALPAARFCVDDQARAEREVGLPGRSGG